VAEATEGLGYRVSASLSIRFRRMFTAETLRRGEDNGKGKPERTEVAEATEGLGYRVSASLSLGESSPRRHGDTEENKKQKRREGTEVAEATEGLGYRVPASSSFRFGRKFTTEARRHGGKQKSTPESAEGAEIAEGKACGSLRPRRFGRMITTEARRHGGKQSQRQTREHRGGGGHGGVRFLGPLRPLDSVREDRCEDGVAKRLLM